MDFSKDNMKTKDIIILIGASGSGKSTFAEVLCSQIGWVTVSADDYFVNFNTKEYKFNVEKLGAAHSDCQRLFKAFLEEPSVKGIVVANTNTKPADFKYYEDLAKKGGHRVFHIVMQNRHGGQNIHNVPFATLDKQKQNIYSNLML